MQSNLRKYGKHRQLRKSTLLSRPRRILLERVSPASAGLIDYCVLCAFSKSPLVLEWFAQRTGAHFVRLLPTVLPLHLFSLVGSLRGLVLTQHAEFIAHNFLRKRQIAEFSLDARTAQQVRMQRNTDKRRGAALKCLARRVGANPADKQLWRP